MGRNLPPASRCVGALGGSNLSPTLLCCCTSYGTKCKILFRPMNKDYPRPEMWANFLDPFFTRPPKLSPPILHVCRPSSTSLAHPPHNPPSRSAKRPNSHPVPSRSAALDRCLAPESNPYRLVPVPRHGPLNLTNRLWTAGTDLITCFRYERG